MRDSKSWSDSGICVAQDRRDGLADATHQMMILSRRLEPFRLSRSSCLELSRATRFTSSVISGVGPVTTRRKLCGENDMAVPILDSRDGEPSWLNVPSRLHLDIRPEAADGGLAIYNG